MNTETYLICALLLSLAVIVWCIIVISKLRADVKWYNSQMTSYLKAIHGLLVPPANRGGYNYRHEIVKKKCTGCAGGCEECRPKKSTAKNTLKPFTLTCKCGHAGEPEVEENGPHHTATCKQCGKFIKHLSAGELRVWKNYSGQLAS